MSKDSCEIITKKSYSSKKFKFNKKDAFQSDKKKIAVSLSKMSGLVEFTWYRCQLHSYTTIEFTPLATNTKRKEVEINSIEQIQNFFLDTL